MKKTFIGIVFLSIVWLSSCSGTAKPDNEAGKTNIAAEVATVSNTEPQPANDASIPESGKVIHLTKAMFLEKVYNYEKSPNQWTFIGDKPCIIDFYADWCKPCKIIAPIMAELAEKYKGELIIYKVNTDQERELAQFFGIRSIPTLYFCPTKGDPQMTQGALPKETYEKVITEVLLKK